MGHVPTPPRVHSATVDTLTVTWRAPNLPPGVFVDSYHLFCSEGSGRWPNPERDIAVYTGGKCEFVHTGLRPGTTYSYCVTAMSRANGTPLLSGASAVATGATRQQGGITR